MGIDAQLLLTNIFPSAKPKSAVDETHKKAVEGATPLLGLTVILQFHMLAGCDKGATLSATHCRFCQKKTKTGGQKLTLLQLIFSVRGQM